MLYFECETEYCVVTVIEVRLSSWHFIGVELVYLTKLDTRDAAEGKVLEH